MATQDLFMYINKWMAVLWVHSRPSSRIIF